MKNALRESVITFFNLHSHEFRICESGQFHGFVIPGDKLPEEVLLSVGEIRESVFRKSLHGSGNHRDLDGFDSYYYHALVWDTVKNEILGGYRFRTNKNWSPELIAKQSYIEKCYPNIYKIMSQDHKIIELGRSFVSEQYQKGPLSLFLIWRVILLFIDKFYKSHTKIIGLPWVKLDHLSDDSAGLLIQVLSNEYFYKSLEGIRPGIPFVNKYCLSKELDSISRAQNDMSATFKLIYKMEQNTNCLPVLLRQYISLMEAKVHGFSVAPDFNNLLEVLMSTDLSDVSVNRINRYMRI